MTPLYYAGYRIEIHRGPHYVSTVWRPGDSQPWLKDHIVVVDDGYEAVIRTLCEKIRNDRERSPAPEPSKSVCG